LNKSLLEGALHQALNDGYQGLWATGDMSREFGPERDFSKLLDYEWRLEELFQKHPGSLWHLPISCGYLAA
jgi:hypothetical protein